MPSSFLHRPVLVAEVLTALQPRAGGRYADGTVGGAGHASAILRASAPDGWLFGCDRDGAAIEAAAERLREFAGRFELRRGSFDHLAEWMAAASCDGVLLDLGVSSPQLDRAERGFSFQQDAPLDMRMDQRQPLTAAKLVAEAPEEELARIFREWGEERHWRSIARALVRAREAGPIASTGRLAELVERAVGRRGRIHPATRVFQALRMAVNDELRLLRAGLEAAWTILKPGGRLAVITFHSLEDRLVKQYGRELEREYVVDGPVDVPELRRPKPSELRWVHRKAVRPGAAEMAENPRARSAQLRVMEKLKAHGQEP